MYEGVEAGEDEQRHHGAQRHHVVELGRQDGADFAVLHRLIGRRVLQPGGEVLRHTGEAEDTALSLPLWSAAEKNRVNLPQTEG